MAHKKTPDLAGRIRSRRIKLEMGVRGAARESELSLSMWHYLESGKTKNPRLDTLKVVAKTLKCNVGDLVD